MKSWKLNRWHPIICSKNRTRLWPSSYFRMMTSKFELITINIIFLELITKILSPLSYFYHWGSHFWPSAPWHRYEESVRMLQQVCTYVSQLICWVSRADRPSSHITRLTVYQQLPNVYHKADMINDGTTFRYLMWEIAFNRLLHKVHRDYSFIFLNSLRNFLFINGKHMNSMKVKHWFSY